MGGWVSAGITAQGSSPSPLSIPYIFQPALPPTPVYCSLHSSLIPQVRTRALPIFTLPPGPHPLSMQTPKPMHLCLGLFLLRCACLPPQAPSTAPTQLAIELVLGTDMKSHFSIISHFRAIHRLSDSATVAARGGGGAPSVARSMARRSQCSGYCGSVVSDASGIEVSAGFRVWTKVFTT